MALTSNITVSGTVTNSDLHSMRFTRGSDGALYGAVIFYLDGKLHEAIWVLTSDQKTTLINDFLPEAKQAIRDKYGL